MENQVGKALRRPSTISDENFVLVRLTAVTSGYPQTRFPEGFLTQAAMILEGYPRECVEYVSAPKTGVQSRERFLTLAAIREACEAYMAPIYRQQDLERRRLIQIEDRRRHETPRDPTIGRLLQELAANLGRAN